MRVITHGVYVLKTGNNIGKDGTKELCEGLMMNKTLLKLNISGMGIKVSFFCFKNQLNIGRTTGNAIGDEGAKTVCETLKTNQTLLELSLWSL